MATLKQKSITLEQARDIVCSDKYVVIDNDYCGEHVLREAVFDLDEENRIALFSGGKWDGDKLILYPAASHEDCINGRWSLVRTASETLIVLFNGKADFPVFEGTILRYDITIERLLNV